jgi:predicted nucleotide-binding protein
LQLNGRALGASASGWSRRRYMFYHAMIEIPEKQGKTSRNREIFELDKTELSEIIDDVVVPYLKHQEFQFNGYFMKPDNILRLVVKRTNESVKTHADYENDHMPSGVLVFVSPSDILSYDKYATDITKEAMATGREKISQGRPATAPRPVAAPSPERKRVFVVHGHDDLAKTTVARFVEKLGFEPIILHEQASAGRTIIEKIEKFSDVGFAIVIYTGDDLGAKSDPKPALQPRARQNVVFEHGFFIAKLGRDRVAALVKGEIETPSDIDGIVYVPLDNGGAWTVAVSKEMKAAGYAIDMNKLL